MNNTQKFLTVGAVLLSQINFDTKSAPEAHVVPSFENCQKCVVLAEQSSNRVAILDLDDNSIIWEWRPELSTVKREHLAWFKYTSEAKVVYQDNYILMTASGGAVALIRIADKKLIFYAYAGGNPHSAEVLPDGNIVTASSDGNNLKVFRTDTLHFPDKVYSQDIPLSYGHNVVWDRENKVLWTASMNQLKTFTYNFNCRQPKLFLKDSIDFSGIEAHDLFPVYGENALWISDVKHIFKYSIDKKKLEQISNPYHSVKSVSSRPEPLPVLVVFPDGTPGGWWTDEIHSLKGGSIINLPGFKLYKARWFIPNNFSYHPKAKIVTCKGRL